MSNGNENISRLCEESFPEGNDMTKEDFFIISCHMDMTWELPFDADTDWISWLEQRPWTTLLCDASPSGNKCLDTFESTCMFSGDVKVLGDRVFSLSNGCVYVLQERKFFFTGGDYLFDKNLLNSKKVTKEYIEQKLSEKVLSKSFKCLLNNNWMVDYVLYDNPTDSIEIKDEQPFFPNEKYFLNYILPFIKTKEWIFARHAQDCVHGNCVGLSDKLFTVKTSNNSLSDYYACSEG